MSPPSQRNSATRNRNLYGSVLLDNELWQSLTAMNGRDVPWVHGCALDHGHDGDHGAPAYTTWTRNRSSGFAGPTRVLRASSTIDPSPPGRHSRPHSSAPDRHRSRPSATSTQAHHPVDVGSPVAGSQNEALWAIAAAIDRLADAVSRLRKPAPRQGNSLSCYRCWFSRTVVVVPRRYCTRDDGRAGQPSERLT